MSRAIFRNLISIFLNCEEFCIPCAGEAAHKTRILKRLRKFPYWANGHAVFVRLAVAERNFEAAQASYQAALLLDISHRERSELAELLKSSGNLT